MRPEKSSPESQKKAALRQTNQPAGISALGSCLVEGNAGMDAGSGRARRKALGVSALVQFCAVCAVVIVPLFATGGRLVMLGHADFIPIPPYGGNSAPAALPPTQDHAPRTINSGDTPFRRVNTTQIQAPNKIPATISETIPPAAAMDATVAANSTGAENGGEGSSGSANLLMGFHADPGPQPPKPVARPAPVSVAPIAVSQGVQLALLIRRVEPIYPMIARMRRAMPFPNGAFVPLN